MLKVVRTPLAQKDVAEIAIKIAADHPAAALRVVDQIDAVTLKLAQFPELGKAVAELRSGMRRTSAGPYAIYYRILGETIEIDRVVHGARDIGRVFE